MFIDRAGLAVSDGPTHHGIFDVAFLSHIPEVEILAPADYSSLQKCVNYSYVCDSPIAVRYANSQQSEIIVNHTWYDNSNMPEFVRCDFDTNARCKNIFVCYGQITENVILAKKALNDSGIDCGIVLVERISPYKPVVEFLKTLISDNTHIVYVEEGIKIGGAGVTTRDMLTESGVLTSTIAFEVVAIESFANPKESCELYDSLGLSPDKLAAHFKEQR